MFVEWGSNDVEVLLQNFRFHRLSFDMAALPDHCAPERWAVTAI